MSGSWLRSSAWAGWAVFSAALGLGEAVWQPTVAWMSVSALASELDDDAPPPPPTGTSSRSTRTRETSADDLIAESRPLVRTAKPKLDVTAAPTLSAPSLKADTKAPVAEKPAKRETAKVTISKPVVTKADKPQSTTTAPEKIEKKATVTTAKKDPKSTSESAKPVETPKVAEAETKPAEEAAPKRLSPQLETLKVKVRKTLATFYPRKLNTRDHSSWEVMHSIVAYGMECELFRSGANGPTVNAVDWLCQGGICKNDRLVYLERGRVSARQGVGVQGHHGQFLAILAQSHVPADHPMSIEGKSYKLSDLIESEKLGCHSGMELTFKLIALVHYLKTDDTWKNELGQTWSIPRLIQEEIASPIRGAACGGTHRLMGLSYAVRNRTERGEPVIGEYARARKYLADYHKYTLAMQNPDGSFSTEWFVRRADWMDVDRKVQTTGHILEWLVYSLPEEDLDDPRVVRAVDFLSSTLLGGLQHDWSIGPLGHALHALAMYDERVFKAQEQQPAIVDAPKPRDLEKDASKAEAPRLLPVAQGDPEAKKIESLDELLAEPTDGDLKAAPALTGPSLGSPNEPGTAEAPSKSNTRR
jgi:hypothetical protein